MDDDLIYQLKEALPEVVIICNTGCRKDTIVHKLQYADAAVVGTTFKENGDFTAHVDENRVWDFMQVVSEYRKSL